MLSFLYFFFFFKAVSLFFFSFSRRKKSLPLTRFRAAFLSLSGIEEGLEIPSHSPSIALKSPTLLRQTHTQEKNKDV